MLIAALTAGGYFTYRTIQSLHAITQRELELQAYRRLNEYFAPKNFDQKITQVETDLRLYLRRRPDTDRFSDLQADIMG